MEGSHYPLDSNTSFTEIPSITLSDDNPNYGYTPRSAADIAQERLWNDLMALYSANENMKKDAMKLDPNSTSRDIGGDGDTAQMLDEILDAFMSGANSVLEELTILGNAHPALAVAIFAFHEVVKLDIARRDNNKKVLVVVLQMQGMMGPIFQLRNLNHSHMPEAERQFHEGRLSETVECITRDIKMCRSDIQHFMNRKFVYKLVLANGYEKKFAAHMETFARRRAELQSVISEYVAIGISTANIAISQVGAKVDAIDIKLDKIISTLFRNLDTSREKDVFKFMQQNGGPEKCVNDLDLLPKLVSKAGESPKTGKVAISDQAELEELQKSLREVLKEDLDKVLEKHYSRFEKVLQVQSNNLKRMSAHLEDQGVLMQTHNTKLGKILDTVTTIMVLEEGKFRTKEVKLKDPEIHAIWTRMNLGTSSVKAKVFVLTFRDHIRAENSTMGSPVQGLVPLPPNETVESNMLQPAATSTDKKSDSEWVFEYIDVAYVQPIVEAMDEDGSGFISVKEANSFALSRDRPKDTKLLSWIAYWAAGWHLNLIKYQKDIYSILLQMHEALPSIHVANRTYVDDFLDKKAMRRVEALCRSIKPLPDTSRKDPKLMSVANEVASWQLERLKTNLSDMGYVIESSFDAMTISGSLRVETWIFPILYLLLQRYLEIVKLAMTVVLDISEFESHIASLTSVFSVFDERMENLEAKFCQLHRDVDAQFRSFSYGMFYAAYKKNELDTSLNTLLTLKIDEYVEQKEDPAKEKGIPPNTSILSKPVGKGLDFVEYDLHPPTPPLPEHVPHPIEGNWFGWAAWNGNNHMRPHRCVIHPVVDNKLVGKGEAFFGAIDFVGTVSPDPDPEAKGKIKVKFEFIPESSDWGGQVCEGYYDPMRDTIEGTFEWRDDIPVPAVEGLPTPEPDVDPTETANGERKETETVNEIEMTTENGEGRVPEPPAEEQTNDKGAKTPGEKEGDDMATPTDNASVEPATKTEKSREEQPYANTETIEELLSEDISKPSTDGPLSPKVEGEGEIVQPEDIEKAEVESETGNQEVKEKDGDGDEKKVEEKAEENNEEQGQDKEDEAVMAEEQEEVEADRHFYLTRTPPNAFRFRTLLDGPGPAPCWGAWPLSRKRWMFAIKAVMYETRPPKKVITDALEERRNWLHHSIRYDLTDPSVTTRWWRFDSFTDKQWDTYDALITIMQPDMARIWEETAHFMARRETYIVGRLVCDLCGKLIAFCRHQCIVCMKDDLSSSIDLCQNCFDKPAGVIRGVSSNFAHLPSHSLLRSCSRVHSYEVNSLIPAARLTSERCKKMFRELEDAEKEKWKEKTIVRVRGKLVKGKGSRKTAAEQHKLIARLEPVEAPPIQCACCDEKVSLPCWVCLECSPLAFICVRCEHRNAQVKQSEHSVLEHHLLLIHDSAEVKSTSKLGKGSDVERQLDHINASIVALDEKVNLQLDEVKEVKVVVEDMAKTMGLEWDIDAVPGEDVLVPSVIGTVDGDNHPEGEDRVDSVEDPVGEQLGSDLDTPLVPASGEGEGDGNNQPPESMTMTVNGKALSSGKGDDHEYIEGSKNVGSSGAQRQQLSLRDRLTALEEKVENINQTVSRSIAQARDDGPAVAELGHKLDALEAKMDQQFGALLALMQNFVARSEA